jgi:hypothetical protein
MGSSLALRHFHLKRNKSSHNNNPKVALQDLTPMESSARDKPWRYGLGSRQVRYQHEENTPACIRPAHLAAKMCRPPNARIQTRKRMVRMIVTHIGMSMPSIIPKIQRN